MQRKTRLLALLLAVCLCLPPSAAAAGASADGARAVFSVSAPDASGVFTLTLTLYDAVFNTFQFALHYDPAAVTPVSATGAAATQFSAMAEPLAGWMSTIGGSLDRAGGLICFTGYLTPGASDDRVTNGNVVAGADGIAVYRFRFRALGTGSAGFSLATQATGAYDASLPDGAGLARAGYSVPLTVSFTGASSLGLPAAVTVGTTERASSDGVSAQTLLDSSILLQIGSNAAVVDGGVSAIYAGEPAVQPYVKQGRTYVPVRFVAEALGASVTYQNRTVRVTLGPDVIEMYIGKTTYTINGVAHEMDAAPEFTPSYAAGGVRTMVPIRFLAEALGMQVEWTGRDKLVLISPKYEWKLDETAEQSALTQASSLLALYGGFIA